MNKPNKHIHYFFDMDGVIARWADASIEETHQEGFFLRRDPETMAVMAMKRMIELGYHVSILSAAYTDDHSERDKINWLYKVGLGHVDRIFVPYGKDKHDYLTEKGILNVLIDDFSKNLFAWEGAGKEYLGIKFMNGINGTKKTWCGYTVSNRMSTEKMVIAITSIAEAEAEKEA